MEKHLTGSKCIRKSTRQQLNAMVEYMELNPEFARGLYGTNRKSTEDKWRKLAMKLNSFGPPMRTLVEWKKTWADLKSRTKKKIVGNCNGMSETEGGVYRDNSLSSLEEAIDRTLFLSAVAASKTKSSGPRGCNLSPIDKCFVSLGETSPPTSENYLYDETSEVHDESNNSEFEAITKTEYILEEMPTNMDGDLNTGNELLQHIENGETPLEKYDDSLLIFLKENIKFVTDQALKDDMAEEIIAIVLRYKKKQRDIN